MKKIHIYLSSLLILLSACGEDFTDLSPISERNVGSFYQTATDFEVAISGAYDALQADGTYGRTYILMNEMRSDNVANDAGASGLAASLEQIDQFGEFSDNEYVRNAWVASYVGIARTNAILDRIEAADFHQELKDQIKGEALFIRSLIYYNLAVLFGNVPLQLTEVTSPENIGINQVSADELYAQIAQDLEEAEALLPLTNSASYVVGRATRGAATTLLGKVLLTAGDQAAAADAFRRVISSQQYALVDDYSALWGAENENNVESIFEIQFKSGGQGEGSGYIEFFATPLSISGGVGGGNTPVAITDDLLELFNTDDGRYNASIAYDEATDVFYVNKYTGSQSIAFDADNNWVVMRYADVLLMLAEALGEGSEAYDLINQVRSKRGLEPISATTPGSFEDKLLEERRLEFAFENHRWQDLLRFGRAKSVMSAHLGIPESQVTLLYPIPLDEITVSRGELEQNPEHQ